METLNSVGHWIRRQRKILDLTQQLLAERVGCSVAAIKKIENDERQPSHQIAERLAEVLGVSASQRDVFLDVARGLRSADQLMLAHEPQALTPARKSTLPTGTVTFLYTDIEGSTQLWKQHHQAMATAHARHTGYLGQAKRIYHETIIGWKDLENRGAVAQMRELLNASDFNSLWAHGRAMSMKQAIGFAL